MHDKNSIGIGIGIVVVLLIFAVISTFNNYGIQKNREKKKPLYTLRQYKQLKLNSFLPYWSVCDNLGGKGQEVLRYIVDGKEIVNYAWRNPDGSVLLLTFTDGFLTDKSFYNRK